MCSLLGGTALNYVGHRACVRRASVGARKGQKYLYMAELARQTSFMDGQERNHLHRATRNGVWPGLITHRLNVTELSLEKFRDNLCLRYGMMPQDIPATCDGCSNNFSINHTLSCPKLVHVMLWSDNTSNYWGSLGSDICYTNTHTHTHRISLGVFWTHILNIYCMGYPFFMVRG